MSDLPDWVDTVHGFDRARWWIPIVCTGKHTHRLDVLGLIFEHDDGRIRWSPGPAIAEGMPGIAFTHMWVTDDTTPDEAELVRDLSGRGSMYVRCSRGCNPRIPRETWDGLVSNARRAGVDWVDVSKYG